MKPQQFDVMIFGIEQSTEVLHPILNESDCEDFMEQELMRTGRAIFLFHYGIPKANCGTFKRYSLKNYNTTISTKSLRRVRESRGAFIKLVNFMLPDEYLSAKALRLVQVFMKRRGIVRLSVSTQTTYIKLVWKFMQNILKRKSPSAETKTSGRRTAKAYRIMWAVRRRP